MHATPNPRPATRQRWLSRRQGCAVTAAGRAAATIRRRPIGDEGMTTAEYAVGTIGACGFAACLIKLAESSWFSTLLEQILSQIVHFLPV